MLNQLLILIGKQVNDYCRMLGTFKEPLEFFPMGTISSEMKFAAYLAGILDLAFIIISSGVLIFWIVLLLFGFPLVLLFPGGHGDWTTFTSSV